MGVWVCGWWRVWWGGGAGGWPGSLRGSGGQRHCIPGCPKRPPQRLPPLLRPRSLADAACAAGTDARASLPTACPCCPLALAATRRRCGMATQRVRPLPPGCPASTIRCGPSPTLHSVSSPSSWQPRGRLPAAAWRGHASPPCQPGWAAGSACQLAASRPCRCRDSPRWGALSHCTPLPCLPACLRGRACVHMASLHSPTCPPACPARRWCTRWRPRRPGAAPHCPTTAPRCRWRCWGRCWQRWSGRTGSAWAWPWLPRQVGLVLVLGVGRVGWVGVAGLRWTGRGQGGGFRGQSREAE